mgnify:CR=1 FL=1
MTSYTLDQLNFLIQFTHLEKLHADLPGMDEATIAHIFGLEPLVFQQIREGFRQRAIQAAKELLAEPDFRQRLGQLPFRPGATVVAIGDSITDDYQSWAEILRHALGLSRPQDGIQLVNIAISGDTTTHLITRFLGAVQQQPEWILCMIGTNDARTHGLKPLKTTVSLEETTRNLEMLRNFAATQIGARWVWITPAPVIPEKIAAHWYLGPLQLGWSNEDLAAIADLIRRQPEPVVDLWPVFGDPAQPALLQDDGLHPSIEGQKAILRALVRRLT